MAAADELSCNEVAGVESSSFLRILRFFAAKPGPARFRSEAGFFTAECTENADGEGRFIHRCHRCSQMEPEKKILSLSVPSVICVHRCPLWIKLRRFPPGFEFLLRPAPSVPSAVKRPRPNRPIRTTLQKPHCSVGRVGKPPTADRQTGRAGLSREKAQNTQKRRSR